MAISNPKLEHYPFLKHMYSDAYFPDFLVDKGKQILVQLCEQLEAQAPTDAEGVYRLTHAATEAFNALAEEFGEHDSEIETVAREAIAADIDAIVRANGFELDVEELIAPRDW